MSARHSARGRSACEGHAPPSAASVLARALSCSKTCPLWWTPGTPRSTGAARRSGCLGSRSHGCGLRAATGHRPYRRPRGCRKPGHRGTCQRWQAVGLAPTATEHVAPVPFGVWEPPRSMRSVSTPLRPQAFGPGIRMSAEQCASPRGEGRDLLCVDPLRWVGTALVGRQHWRQGLHGRSDRVPRSAAARLCQALVSGPMSSAEMRESATVPSRHRPRGRRFSSVTRLTAVADRWDRIHPGAKFPTVERHAWPGRWQRLCGGLGQAPRCGGRRAATDLLGALTEVIAMHLDHGGRASLST